MEQNYAQFDLIVFLDHRSLAEADLSFLDGIDDSKTKVRVMTREVALFNDRYKNMADAEKKKVFKEKKVDLLNRLIGENKLRFLGAADEQDPEYRLLAILVGKYYRQNVLLITNDAEKAKPFLPLIPVYEVFGQVLKIISLTDTATEYAFEDSRKALAKLSAAGESAPSATDAAEPAKEEEDRTAEAREEQNAETAGQDDAEKNDPDGEEGGKAEILEPSGSREDQPDDEFDF